MTKILVAYFTILIIYLILDGIWLGIVSKDSYVSAIGELMRDKAIIWPWIVFYVSYGFAILYLCVMPNISTMDVTNTAIAAAILGMASYGAYNMTNYAILKDWPIGITFKDWAWGIFITTASASGAMLVLKKVF